MEIYGILTVLVAGLGSDVVLYAGGRFESHGTAGAFVEHVTMSLLDVRLH